MAVLGKRKSRRPPVSDEDANEILRQHFEASFLPISKAMATTFDESADEDESDEEEWGGLSGDDDSSEEGVEDEEDDLQVPEVVDHSSEVPKTVAMSKRELKAFMSSRPPDQSSPSASSNPSSRPTTSASTLPEDAPSLLAQDLELRRLISESHLLSSPSLTSAKSSTGSEPRTFAAGRIRQKAMDLRMQALGAKTSLHKQEKMPMKMRKGMVAAAGAREAKRRKEARENGIILERESSGAGAGKAKRKQQRRDSGALDRPGVGRMRGAQLSLSERDVKSIEGTRDTFGRRSKR